MKQSERDAAQLWDMLDAATHIRALMDGLSHAALMQDEMRLLAVERLLEIIGEAARRVSTEARLANIDIPWQAIIAFRNVLAHEYGDINYERLYAVASKSVPELIVKLEKLVSPRP